MMVFTVADSTLHARGTLAGDERRLTILIVATYPIARAGLTAILGGYPDLAVVGQSAGGSDLPALVEATAPALLLLDHERGDEEGLERLERLLSNRRDLAALILGTDRTEDALLEALATGARGYLPRETGSDELVAAVRAVAAGLLVIHPAPAAPLLERLLERRHAYPGLPANPTEALTPRELEVLQALATGLTNRAIARQLSVSENTVKFHVSSILTKLDAASRAEAVALAARRGLLLL